MGNKIITEKDFWVCSGGLVPAQLQTHQRSTKKEVGTFHYVTVEDTATSSKMDFSCKKLMLIAALLAVAITLAVVATGGLALVAICAAAAAGGAVVGAIAGAFLCGQKAAAARYWLDSKSNLIIQGQQAITGDHVMLCTIFGETITFAPQIKNWWQAYALGASNLIGETLKCAMYGAAIGSGVAILEGGPAVLAEFGLQNVGANWLATWGGSGLALRGVMGAQSMLGAYGRTGTLTAGDVATGVFSMEVGTAKAAGNILSGQGTFDDVLGLAMWMLPAPKESTRPNEESRGEENNPNEEPPEETPSEEENPQARTNEAENAPEEGEKNAYEQDTGSEPTEEATPPATEEPVDPVNNPNEVPGIRDFNEWFNNLTPEQFDRLWSDPAARATIKARIRYPGGLHEWLMVARTNVFKRWGVSMEQIKDMRTGTGDVRFENPPGRHGGPGSTTAHNEILDIIDNSSSFDNFRDNLRDWADRRLEGGRDALPDGLK